MNLKNILIAAAFLIFLSGLLNGCALIETEGQKPAASAKPRFSEYLQKTLLKAEAAKKEVSMVFKAEKEGGQVKVTITLENPNRKPITSVQSWLAFDPEKLKGKEINVEKTAFTLMVPYNNTFDNEKGLVMIGRSNPTEVTDQNIPVAEVVFDVVKDETATIEAYDYREDLSGHTSVNALVDGKPYNILIRPFTPALVIKN